MKYDQKVYLKKVVEIVSNSTIIDYDKEVIRTPGGFPIYFVSSLDYPFNFFIDYCKDNFGLDDDESLYVWYEYSKMLNKKVSNFGKNLNETTERDKKNMIKYLDYIKSDMRSGVSFNGIHFYLFGCNISVHLNHNDYPPYFAWVPSCFKEVVKNNYGLPDDMITDLWYDWFGDYIRDQYMTMKRLR